MVSDGRIFADNVEVYKQNIISILYTRNLIKEGKTKYMLTNYIHVDKKKPYNCKALSKFS